MIVDVLRSGYSTDCRFYAGSDQLEKLYWYECQPGAKALPFPTAFCSSVWELDPDHAGPGEVNFGSKTWSPTNGPPLPGDHWHGDPSWFLHGIPADLPPLPPTARPCTAWAQRGAGGVAGGGSAFGSVQLGRGGVGGGGDSSRQVQLGRGGAGGGGRGFQTGGGYAQVAFGGAGGGGRGFQTGGGYAQLTFGGAGGGGEATQGPGGILTPCCPGVAITDTLTWEFSGGQAPDCNPSFTVFYDFDPGSDAWRNYPVAFPGQPPAYILSLFCDGTDWQAEIGDFGSSILLTLVSVSCEPFELVFSVDWSGLDNPPPCSPPPDTVTIHP